MLKSVYEMHGLLFEYPGMGAWTFVAVSQDKTAEIKATFADMKRGFGSLKVVATVGKTKWKTSIFPDNERGVYLLPVKSEVRKKEKVKAGDEISFTIEILV